MGYFIATPIVWVLLGLEINVQLGVAGQLAKHIEPGAWRGDSAHFLDWHRGVTDIEECAAICQGSTKCRKYQFNPRAHTCQHYRAGAPPREMAGWIRSAGVGCDLYCDDHFDPVCDTDDTYYQNKCHFEEAVCANPSVTAGVCYLCQDPIHCGRLGVCTGNMCYCDGGALCTDQDCGTCAPQCDVDGDCQDGLTTTICEANKKCLCPAFSGQFNCDGNEERLCSSCACFAASSMVAIMSGQGTKQIRIDELKIGDQVASVDALGNVVFEEVYFESHMFPSFLSEEITEFRRLQFDGGFLDITSIHLLYVSSDNVSPTNDNCISHASEQICVYPARIVSVGDTIWMADLDNEFQLSPRNVTEITTVYNKPRAPRTMNGNIIVNGILCSNHAYHHNTEQAIYLFLRAIYSLSPSILETEQFAAIWKHPTFRSIRGIFRPWGTEDTLYAEHAYLVVYSCYFLTILVAVKFVGKFLKFSSTKAK